MVVLAITVGLTMELQWDARDSSAFLSGIYYVCACWLFLIYHLVGYNEYCEIAVTYIYCYTESYTYMTRVTMKTDKAQQSTASASIARFRDVIPFPA